MSRRVLLLGDSPVLLGLGEQRTGALAHNLALLRRRLEAGKPLAREEVALLGNANAEAFRELLPLLQEVERVENARRAALADVDRRFGR
jgi:hypothetical protein